MSLSKKEYGDLLSRCMVIDKTIQVPGLSPNMIMDFYMKFSRDLFGMDIPHYRVVGIWHDYDDKHASSVFRTNDIFGQSCIELSMKMKYLVPMENGGNEGSLGCWYGISEDMSMYELSDDFKGFCRDWGLDNVKGIDHRTANILQYSKDVIGSLMIDTSHDDLPQKNTFTTSDVWYTKRMPYDVEFPKVLIPNKFLSGIQDTILGKAPTFMFIMRGTGQMSYAETQKLFSDRCDRIMPCDTRWDLSEFFVPRIPDAGDHMLKLTCFEQIDEFVLQNILHEYGRSIVNDEC